MAAAQTEAVRIEKKLFDRIKAIADREGRTYKAQLERIIEAGLKKGTPSEPQKQATPEP